MIEYLTLDELRDAAATVLGMDRRTVPFRDQGAADSALHAIQPVFGHDPYPDVPTKAAVLAYRVARAHPLVDGNKRTATLCLYGFAEANGHDVTMPERDLEEAMVAGAADELTQDEFVALVAPTITPRPTTPPRPSDSLAAEPTATYQASPQRRPRRP